MTTSIEKLEQEVEALVWAHLAAYERAAKAAVERAFTKVTAHRR